MVDYKDFKVSVSDQQLDDLKQRLSLARFPDELDEAAWDYGAPLDEIQRLTKYWQTTFDWKAAEAKINQLPSFSTSIQCDYFEPLNIHFIYAESPDPKAVPLLFCHGWPGSFLEVTKVLKPLTQGGKGKQAFHVVAPSLPNFGFSDGTKKRGFGTAKYAETMHKLMLKLGYDQYVTQGGDWGWSITRAMSKLYPAHCKATHLNMDVGKHPSLLESPLTTIQHAITPYTSREQHGIGRSKWFNEEGRGYNLLQSTKPQTIGYALADSPVALLAWIYEKMHDWSDSYPWSDDEICTWISVYWFSTAGPAAACRIYYERQHEEGEISGAVLGAWIPEVKIGMSHFPGDIQVLPKTWMKRLGNIVFEKEHGKGGHFAAYETPEMIVEDLREMFGVGGGAYGVVSVK